MAGFGLKTPPPVRCFPLSFRCIGPRPCAASSKFREQLKQAESNHMTSKNGRTILIGEDELEVRGYLEMALKCLGYSVELAQDGDEVLTCLESSRSEISAVLLDIMMPTRDGMDTLREIRRIDPTLPVIIVSGASSTLNVVTAMKTGATYFLSKPVSHEDLRKAVTRALEMKGIEYVPPARNSAPVTKAYLGKNPR